MAAGLADVNVVQAGSNNGTLTPATPGSLTTTAGNMLVLLIAVAGTVTPTIATPATWTLVQSNNVANSITAAMFILPNNPGGATNPSSTLGGTITGWVASMIELNHTGSAEGLMTSATRSTAAQAQLPNVFGTLGGAQQMPHSLYLYYVARKTATIVTQNTLIPWSVSIQSNGGVQGVSTDFYFATNLSEDNPAAYQYSSTGPAAVSNSQVINAGTINSGQGGLPSASGLLASAVDSVQVGAILNAAIQQPQTGVIIGGSAGLYVPQFYQGTIGG